MRARRDGQGGDRAARLDHSDFIAIDALDRRRWRLKYKEMLLKYEDIYGKICLKLNIILFF